MGDRDLRVSDVEREHVGRLLQRAVGLGMLSLGEFTERMDTALASKTRGELNSVLVDLPGIRLAGQPAPPPPRYVHAQRMPVQQSGPGNLIRARMSSITRKGSWQVPPTLYLDNRMAHVELDFTQAIMSTQVVELRVEDKFSHIELIVPAEATVDMNGLDLIGSSIDNKVRTGPPIGPLHLVLVGNLRFSSVTAKHPFGTHWRRFLNGA
ncbi:DUF1707 domain-containing protein [Nocardia sp. NPDC020380]|uniref:DUF1707 domain-containing protein n=1 Tax=Nocardia sp. NPDC020380 TaxID=3364309 RepID=UPI0037A22F7A